MALVARITWTRPCAGARSARPGSGWKGRCQTPINSIRKTCKPKKTQQKVFTPALEAARNDLLKYLEASCYLVISHDGYWGRGNTIDQGARCAKQGASRSGSASVLLILGDEAAEINEAGYVIRDAGSHSITIIQRTRLGSLLRKP